MSPPAANANAVVHLGFSVALAKEDDDDQQRSTAAHHSPRWKDWDGGQMGGRPSWLQPRDLPRDPIRCHNCHEPLSFVCQLYAPADEINPDAFHRTLYIFGCPNIQCAHSTTGSIRVFRTQLPRDNPFFPEYTDDDSATTTTTMTIWTRHRPEAWNVNVCHVCHQRGHGKCPIQGLQFCGKHHQREYKKYIFDKREQLVVSKNDDIDVSLLPSICAESELVVEDEPRKYESTEGTLDRKADKALFGKGAGNHDDVDEDGNDDDEDRDLEQDDLNQMTGALGSSSSKDPVTMAFFDRVSGVPNVQDQCLRYLRWPDESMGNEQGAPLWIRQDYQPDSIPPCEHCGSQRKFECQLMPQMLHYLLKCHERNRVPGENKINQKNDKIKEAIEKASSILEQAPTEQIPPAFVEAKEKAVEALRTQLLEGQNELSWGVVSIYTCTSSCGGKAVAEGSELGTYQEEFAWKQPSLD
jgi:pre-rRNA-processing protein TSR4